jgi:hypothetical protein
MRLRIASSFRTRILTSCESFLSPSFPAKQIIEQQAGKAGVGRKTNEANGTSAQPSAVELIAVLVAVADGRPLAMTIDNGRALPSGPFEVGHRSLQSGLRAWVERRTRHPLGYVEQLYTFRIRTGAMGPRGHARSRSVISAL